MVNQKLCAKCRYWKNYGTHISHCWYCLENHKSRIAQMTPEQRKNGECPFFERRTKSRRARVDYGKVLVLYMQGLSDQKVAKGAGCSQTAVHEWRRMKGLPPNYPNRKRGECNDAKRDAVPVLRGKDPVDHDTGGAEDPH